MPTVKLDHCVIHVSDWERSNAFYRDVLGAELIRRGNGWAYRFGETQLNCHGRALLRGLSQGPFGRKSGERNRKHDPFQRVHAGPPQVIGRVGSPSLAQSALVEPA